MPHSTTAPVTDETGNNGRSKTGVENGKQGPLAVRSTQEHAPNTSDSSRLDTSPRPRLQPGHSKSLSVYSLDPSDHRASPQSTLDQAVMEDETPPSKESTQRVEDETHGSSTWVHKSEHSPQIGTPLVTQSAQRYYIPFPRDQYAAPEGSTLKNYTFFNGAVVGATPKTKLHTVSKRIREADEKLLEWISRGQDATAPSIANGELVPSMVDIIHCPPNPTSEDSSRINTNIRSTLESGRAPCVVLDSHNPTSQWTREDIGRMTTGVPGECSIMASWQSTDKRHLQHKIHRNPNNKTSPVDLCYTGRLSKFLDEVDENTEPINCLDVPLTGGHAPSFVTSISADCFAWDLTQRFGYPTAVPEPSATSKKRGQRGPRAKKVVGKGTEVDRASQQTLGKVGGGGEASQKKRRRSTTLDDKDIRGDYDEGGVSKKARTSRVNPLDTSLHHEVSNKQTGKTGTTTEKASASDFPSKEAFTFSYLAAERTGPAWIELDMAKMRRWMLLTGPFFLTWPHYDAAGLATWIRLLSGVKVWVLMSPKDKAKDVETASKQYLKMTRAMSHLTVETEHLLPELAEAHILFLFPNMILFQPPCMMHAVLTVERSITEGGHFLTWDMLHLTEWTRKLSDLSNCVGTNDFHPSMQRVLNRMMIAMSVRGPTSVAKKPFISLARLVIHAQDYWRGDYESSDDTLPPTLRPESENLTAPQKEAYNEWLEAINIARAILKYNGIYELPPLTVSTEEDNGGAPLSWSVVSSEMESIRSISAWYEVGMEKINIPKFPSL